MGNLGNTKGSHAKRNDPRVVASFEGWHDAWRGRAPNLFWVDHVDPILAAAYQNGRLLAIECRTLCIRPPGWNQPRQIPPRILALRKALCDAAQAADRTTATLYAGASRGRRPKHLVSADLRNELIAKRLASLAPEREHFAY